MKSKVIFLILFLFMVSACEENVPDMEVTVPYEALGQFWVTYAFDDGEGNIEDWYEWGHTLLYISNTSANTSDSVWITDDGNGWQFQVKCGITLNPVTYSVIDGIDLIYDDTTTINGGKLIERQDGDSIFMEIEWSTDPGTIYHVSGRRYKGFLDESGNPSYEADYFN
jgi:hypothetical protein